MSVLNASDLAGNVREWSRDTYQEAYYSECENCTNPLNAATGDQKVVRGGGFNTYSVDLKITNRYDFDASIKASDIGFRCAK